MGMPEGEPEMDAGEEPKARSTPSSTWLSYLKMGEVALGFVIEQCELGLRRTRSIVHTFLTVGVPLE